MVKNITQSQTEPIYRYEYTKVANAGAERKMGAGHWLDVKYVFNHFSKQPDYAPDESERKFGEQEAMYWLSFAKTGNPNSPDATLVWKPYDLRQEQSFVFGEPFQIQSGGVRKEACKFWDENNL